MGQLRQHWGLGAREEQKETMQHGPKPKNSNCFPAKEQSHRNFPGMAKMDLGACKRGRKRLQYFNRCCRKRIRGHPLLEKYHKK